MGAGTGLTGIVGIVGMDIGAVKDACREQKKMDFSEWEEDLKREVARGSKDQRRWYRRIRMMKRTAGDTGCEL